MIGIINQGKGFKGILKYALEKPGAYLVGPVRGTVDELAGEFGMIRSRNPAVEKPVLHIALAIHPEEYLDDNQWERIVKTLMERLGYGDNRYVTVRHTGEPHQHAHIIACRIRNTDGGVVKNFREMIRTEHILRDLERAYGLREVPLSAEVNRRNASHRERKMAARKQQRILKQRFQERIDAARADRPTLTVFLQRLSRLGVGVKPNVGGDRITGIAYELDGVRRKGSQLGKAYAWGGILKTVDYRPERDLAYVKQLAQNPEASSPMADQDRRWLEQRLLMEQEVQKAGARRKAATQHIPASQTLSPGTLHVLNALTQAARRMEPASQSNEDEEDPKKRKDRSR